MLGQDSRRANETRARLRFPGSSRQGSPCEKLSMPTRFRMDFPSRGSAVRDTIASNKCDLAFDHALRVPPSPGDRLLKPSRPQAGSSSVFHKFAYRAAMTSPRCDPHGRVMIWPRLQWCAPETGPTLPHSKGRALSERNWPLLTRTCNPVANAARAREMKPEPSSLRHSAGFKRSAH